MTEPHDRREIRPKESMHISEPLSVGNIVDAVKFIMSQPSPVRIPGLMILPRDHVM